MPAHIDFFAPTTRSVPAAPSAPAPALATLDRTRLAELRARIEQISSGGREQAFAALPLGIAGIDAGLPWGGLPRACLHEVVASNHATAAAAGFCALLLARLLDDGGSVVWCRRHHGCSGHKLHAPGLLAFGLDLRRLLVVHARSETDVLWAMEESLRSGAVAGVVGEITNLPRVAPRRLQLAAETGGATALLLRPTSAAAGADSAATHWRVDSLPSNDASTGAWRPMGPPPEISPLRVQRPAVRWRIALERCKGGIPAEWVVDWCDATHRLVMAAPLRDRPALPVAVVRYNNL
jgi:protein ImuA